MASADRIYVDPSALLKLYLREPESRSVTEWRSRTGDPLIVTQHGHVELVNGIGLAVHRKLIPDSAGNAALAALDQDFREGRFAQADLLWRATLKRAAVLSRDHTRETGCRTLDIIHVASAVELGMRDFVTFDSRQQLLARLCGLRLIVPGKANVGLVLRRRSRTKPK